MRKMNKKMIMFKSYKYFQAKKFTYGKDQKVNTNFLPDSQRDEKIK